MHLSDYVGYVGPTALQVGCSLAAAVCWGIMNPNAGANFPENLPSDFIIGLTKPWLGRWVSVRHDWTPSSVEVAGISSQSSSGLDSSSSDDGSDESDSDSESGNSRENLLTQRSKSPSSGEQSHRSSRANVPEPKLDEWQFRNFVDSPQKLTFLAHRHQPVQQLPPQPQHHHLITQ